jgi:hypothetical protein
MNTTLLQQKKSFKRKKLTEEQVTKIFIKKVLQKRLELQLTPMETTAVSLNEAAQLCSIGTVGNTVTDLITLQEQGDKRDLQDFLDKHMPKIMAFTMVIGVVVLAIYILSKQAGA